MNVAALTAFGFKLPLGQADTDPCTVVDANGQDVFTVDANGERPDQEAEAITKALIEMINAAGAQS